MQIKLSDSKGRDAEVAAGGVTSVEEVRWVDEEGAGVDNRRILRGSAAHDLDAIIAASGGLDKVGDALIEGDPDVDIETFGSFLEDVSRVYVNPGGEICHRVTHYEIVCGPDGEEIERRPREETQSNIAGETPLKWTGKKMKKTDVARRFVFANKLQIRHVNGLTHDFLHGIAKELEDEGCMMLLGGGIKGNEPLVFRQGGLGYRGLLEGRTEGDSYALVLHLTNQELKPPPPAAPEEDKA